MKIDTKIRDEIVLSLRSTIDEFIKRQNSLLSSMTQSETVEEFMRRKQCVLENFIDHLPLGASTCYFCILNGKKNRFSGLLYDFNCSKCQYGKIHGFCLNVRSDYSRLDKARFKLSVVLRSYFHSGEMYPLIEKKGTHGS
jgi:hypothetical protein